MADPGSADRGLRRQAIAVADAARDDEGVFF
jgi:hypothetical protein